MCDLRRCFFNLETQGVMMTDVERTLMKKDLDAEPSHAKLDAWDQGLEACDSLVHRVICITTTSLPSSCVADTTIIRLWGFPRLS